MKSKNKSNKVKKHTNTIVLINGISISVVTSILVALFLSGKIIKIPKGTHEGGVIGAIGVGVILIFMIIVGLIINKIKIYQQKNKTDK